jgi:CRP/FNR family transcriptional regulator, cyclic AMP receptor protein
MSAPYRFVLADDCLSCPLKRNSDFCDLPGEVLVDFSGSGYLSLFPSHVVLLSEGQVPRGVFVLCSGRAKVSAVARDGKQVILKIAGERQVLGLSAVVSGRPSPVTVTTIEHCQVKFIDSRCFLDLVEHDSSAALACAVALSRDVQAAFHGVHGLLLARSSTEKLARLLLSWVVHEPHNLDLRVATDFTHEEMAQMIGSSRETVTRLLGDMQRRELIRLEGATLVIPNRIALQAIAA